MYIVVVYSDFYKNKVAQMYLEVLEDLGVPQSTIVPLRITSSICLPA